MAEYIEAEEGAVGDCSSQRLNGVRREVRELMREALQSEENSELVAELRGSGGSNGGQLLKEKEDLLEEKRSLEIELELRRRLLEEPLADTTISHDDLEERVEELEREVTSAKCLISQEKQLMQRLHSSEILTKHLFQRPDPTAEDKAMKVSVMEGCEAGRKLGRVSEEVKEGEEELVRMRRERYKSLVHCRDLWAQIQECERKQRAGGEDRGEEEVTSRLGELLEKKMTECRLLQGCLQGIIVGSGVDWSEDQQLRELTISLGQTFSWEQH